MNVGMIHEQRRETKIKQRRHELASLDEIERQLERQAGKSDDFSHYLCFAHHSGGYGGEEGER